MGDERGFLSSSVEAGKILKDVINQNEMIRVIAHHDADGISAAGILSRVLYGLGARFHLSVVRQLETEKILELAKEESKSFLFVDMGSGQLPLLVKKFDKKNLFVFDHHTPQEGSYKNLTHVNPHLYGISGSDKISGAGVSYYIATAIDRKFRDLSVLAIVGAMGDRQDKGPNHSLFGLNEKIVKEGQKAGVVTVSQDIRFFGRETRPIYKSIRFTTNPYIKGLSADEAGTINFLEQTGIRLKDGDKWRTLSSLDKDEKTKLVTALIKHMLKEGVPPDKAKDIIGVVYTFPNEPHGTEMRDAREFASLLNACGRTKRPGLGVALAFGDRKTAYDQAQEILYQYRIKLAEALEWLQNNPQNIIRKKYLQSFHGEGIIDDEIIGTIASISIASNLVDNSLVLIAFTDSKNNTVKISARTTYDLVSKGIDLGGALRQVVKKIDPNLQAGGHNIAAGGRVPKGTEKQALTMLDKVLGQQIQKGSK